MIQAKEAGIERWNILHPPTRRLNPTKLMWTGTRMWMLCYSVLYKKTDSKWIQKTQLQTNNIKSEGVNKKQTCVILLMVVVVTHWIDKWGKIDVNEQKEFEWKRRDTQNSCLLLCFATSSVPEINFPCSTRFVLCIYFMLTNRHLHSLSPSFLCGSSQNPDKQTHWSDLFYWGGMIFCFTLIGRVHNTQ